MPEERVGHRSQLITPDTRITVPCALLAVLLWAGSTFVTDAFAIQAAILLIVGVITPITITELRRR
jgi:hypothetical protein